MCEPRLEPGPASLRHPAACRHCRLSGARRSAPGGARGFSPGLGGGRAQPCCPACTRPSCGAAPPELAASPPGGHSLPPLPLQAALAQPPATCGVLLSSPPCKGSTPLSAPSDFGCSCHPEAPSRRSGSSCACLSPRYPVKRLQLPLAEPVVGWLRLGWRLEVTGEGKETSRQLSICKVSGNCEETASPVGINSLLSCC